MYVNLYVIEDYDNVTAYRPEKTNPIKPNFFKGQNEQKNECLLENGTAGRYSANCVWMMLAYLDYWVHSHRIVNFL